MSLRTVIAAELDALGGVTPFDVHAHTGVDVDGTTRSSEEHLRDLDVIGGRSVIFPLHVSSGYGAENRRVLEECASSIPAQRISGLTIPGSRQSCPLPPSQRRRS